MFDPFLILELGRHLARSRRTRAARDAPWPAIRGVIEAEGGAIEHASGIGLLIRSPFPPPRKSPDRDPIYWKVRCRYPRDSGHWLVHHSVRDETYWAWSSDLDSADLPAPRDHTAAIADRVIALAPATSGLVYLGVVLAMLGLFRLDMLVIDSSPGIR